MKIGGEDTLAEAGRIATILCVLAFFWPVGWGVLHPLASYPVGPIRLPHAPLGECERSASMAGIRAKARSPASSS